METRTEKEIRRIIILLKKDNAKNQRSAKKENLMINWNIGMVKKVVDVYLDNVLNLLKINSLAARTK